MESQKPNVILVDVPKGRPSVIPYGGMGGLLFWIAVCVFLGIGTFHFHGAFTVQDRKARALQGESELLRRENQKLHAVVDQLQTELGQTGSLLRLQQELIGQSAAGNGMDDSKKEEPRSQSLSPSETLELRTLEERLDKAFAARLNAKEAAILRREDRIVIVLDHRTLFPGAGLKIGTSGLTLLHEVAAGLQSLPESPEVRVTAFADPSPTTASSRQASLSNWEVSSLRASAVAKQLVEGEHLPAGQVIASCRGAQLPLVKGPGVSPGPSAHRLEIWLILHPDAPLSGWREAKGSGRL
ncbi:OmpA family protein [Verrucomicrobium sp. 3C]|uniref:OmpA/MotB family protein n=1 Tax=Verrucomicrobium sp. 3C TaxID=1134055 RepID=UPI00035F91F3|nr:OmpA family protein [Verrucomicrobium sp. 3C]